MGVPDRRVPNRDDPSGRHADVCQHRVAIVHMPSGCAEWVDARRGGWARFGHALYSLQEVQLMGHPTPANITEEFVLIAAIE